MFKKLFISLLILSALTSEGIICFPGNVYNYYLCSQNRPVVPGLKVMPSESLQTGSDGISKSAAYSTKLYANSSGSSYVLSSGSLQKLKSKSEAGASDYNPNYNYENPGEKVCYFSMPDVNRDIVNEKSGLSPPLV